MKVKISGELPILQWYHRRLLVEERH